MNRKIITRIIGITLTASALSFPPAIGMNLFQKATETAKKVTQAVVNTGAKAAADAVVGVGKIAGTIENDCVELSDKIKQKIVDHERNKQSNIADSVDTILNTPIDEVIDAPQTSLLVSEGRIQKPDPADRKSKSSKSDSSSSSDSDHNLFDKKKLNECSLFDDDRINNKLRKLCKKLTKSNAKNVNGKEILVNALKEINFQLIESDFKAALICLSLDVNDKNNALELWWQYKIPDKLKKYTVDYQKDIFLKMYSSFKKSNDLVLAEHIMNYMSAAKIITTGWY